MRKFIILILLLISSAHADISFDKLKERAASIQSRVETQIIEAHGGSKNKHNPTKRSGLYLAISESIPKSRLEAIFKKTSSIANSLKMPIHIVVRGIDKKDKDLLQYLKRNNWMFDYFKDEPLVGFSIDPVPFIKADISKVPAAIIIEDDESLVTLGFLSFKKMLNHESTIDGTDLSNISEIDMIELMKSKIDPAALEKQARGNAKSYWERYEFPDLPTSKRSDVWIFDPEVEVISDIFDANGKVIAKAGSRINPMKAVPFNRVLIIFNPMDSRQLSLAKNAYDESLRLSQKPILMVTKLGESDGWGSFGKLRKFFGTWNIYIVQKPIIDRFKLRSVPTVIQEHPSLKYKLLISQFECITKVCEL